MKAPSKLSLLVRGTELLTEFCKFNGIKVPQITVVLSKEWRVSACAYYRDNEIRICVERCAHPGTTNRAWSWPGYTVDRTPFGVIQHELGHHVDVLKSKVAGPYFGDFGRIVRNESAEKPITGYCPNDAEWFAEIFRVFVTNPDLLRLIRPHAYRKLSALFVLPVYMTWRQRLRGAPARTIQAAARKVEKANA